MTDLSVINREIALRTTRKKLRDDARVAGTWHLPEASYRTRNVERFPLHIYPSVERVEIQTDAYLGTLHYIQLA